MNLLRNFKINCAVRVLLLSVSIFIFFYVLFRTTLSFYVTIFILGSLIIYQTYALIRYVGKTNRELSRFLLSIKHADFSQSFSAGKLGAAFQELDSGFTEVMNEFRQARSEKEEHFQYLQTVVQHVGIGLISFQPNGEVELINNAAMRLLNVSRLKNVKALRQLSRPLADAILNLKAGKTALVKITSKNQPLHLAINATEFKLKKRLFTLISLQNIQGELERERMTSELEIAREVQRRLLPTNHFSLEGYDIAAICIPAKEVGGDYYDFIHLGDGKFGMVIGDVSGKGVPAAIYMTLTKGIIQAYTEENASPIEILTKVNYLMYRTIERYSFVSMIFAILDIEAKTVTYARAGHNPLIFYQHASKKLSLLQPEGIALGLEAGETFASTIKETTVQLLPNDLLVFFTDGIVEAMNDKQEEFGEQRLLNLIEKNCGKNSKNLIDAIQRHVNDFADQNPQHDDMTMIVLKALV